MARAASGHVARAPSHLATARADHPAGTDASSAASAAVAVEIRPALAGRRNGFTIAGHAGEWLLRIFGAILVRGAAARELDALAKGVLGVAVHVAGTHAGAHAATMSSPTVPIGPAGVLRRHGFADSLDAFALVPRRVADRAIQIGLAAVRRSPRSPTPDVAGTAAAVVTDVARTSTTVVSRAATADVARRSAATGATSCAGSAARSATRARVVARRSTTSGEREPRRAQQCHPAHASRMCIRRAIASFAADRRRIVVQVDGRRAARSGLCHGTAQTRHRRPGRRSAVALKEADCAREGWAGRFGRRGQAW